MERSPNDGRRDIAQRQSGPEPGRTGRDGQLDPKQKTAPGGAQPQPGPRAREFAPGEDGECH